MSTPQQSSAGRALPNPGFVQRSFGLFPQIVYPIGRRQWETDATPRDLVQIATVAERAGFAFITCGDHGVIAEPELNLYGSGRFYDPIATLGFLAGHTSSIRLASLVYQVHLRSPFVSAKAFATLDHLSGGRVVAGFGVGSRAYEAEAAGVAFGHRGAIADDHVRAIVALWTSSPANYEGDYVKFDSVICDPRPVQRPHPAIWFGGNRKRSLDRALRLGDGWAPFGLSTSQLSGVLSVARQTEGWSMRPPDFRVVVPITPLGGRADRGSPPPAFESLSTTAVRRCVEAIGHATDLGATDFLVDLPAPSLGALTEAMDWFARDVAPVAQLVAAPALDTPA